MPAKVTLFDANCKPIYDLGSGPYNIVRWNPFSRFFCICGFGNLPGACGVGGGGGVCTGMCDGVGREKQGGGESCVHAAER